MKVSLTVFPALRPLHGEGRSIELNAFLEIAARDHGHACVWGTVAVLHIDAQELDVHIWVGLVVPDRVACVVPSVPLPPAVEASHTLPNLGVNNRVDAHAIELKATGIRIAVAFPDRRTLEDLSADPLPRPRVKRRIKLAIDGEEAAAAVFGCLPRHQPSHLPCAGAVEDQHTPASENVRRVAQPRRLNDGPSDIDARHRPAVTNTASIECHDLCGVVAAS